VGGAVAVVFLYQITGFYNKTQQHHFWNFILMTQCKLCTRAAVAEVAVNKERSPMGPMQYLQTPGLMYIITVHKSPSTLRIGLRFAKWP